MTTKTLDDAIKALTEAAQLAKGLPQEDPIRLVGLAGEGLALLLRSSKEEAAKKRSEEREQAARLLAEAAELDSKFPGYIAPSEIWVLVGSALAEVDDRLDDALNAFSKAIDCDDQNVFAFLGKGRTLFKLEDYVTALKAFQTAGELESKREDALLGKGQALIQLDQYERAIDVFREGIGLAGETDVRLWVSLGDAYRALGRQQAALGAYQRGWRLGGKKANTRPGAVTLRISSTLLALDRDKEALECLDDEKDEAGGDPQFQYYRGMALYRLRRISEARNAWEEAAKNGAPKAAELVDELKRRGGAEAWVGFWFGGSAAWHRKLLGASLLLLLLLALASSLIEQDAFRSLNWLNTGQDWKVTVAPIVVLLALFLVPTVSRLSLGLGGLTIEPRPSSMQASPQLLAGTDLATEAPVSAKSSPGVSLDADLPPGQQS